jgi:hypothetical protein
MKVKFLISIELECVVGMEEDGETPITEIVVFSRGQEEEVEGVETNSQWNTANIYFSNGKSVYGVPMMIFEIIDLDNQ